MRDSRVRMSRGFDMLALIVRGKKASKLLGRAGCLPVESLPAWRWPGLLPRWFLRCWHKGAIARSAMGLSAWAAFPWITSCLECWPARTRRSLAW